MGKLLKKNGSGYTIFGIFFYKYMDEKYKDELQKYVNSLKGVNKIQDIRIEALQSYKPLVKLDDNK